MIEKPGPIMAHAVDIAGTQVGQREVSENWGGMITRYLQAARIKEPAPWCAAFVVWCIQRAASGMAVPLPAGFPPLNSGYTPSLLAWCLARGSDIKPWTEAKRGDLLFFYWPSLGRIGHVGIIRMAPESGNLFTIEGNGNASGGREGVAVVRKTRAIASLDRRCHVARMPF